MRNLFAWVIILLVGCATASPQPTIAQTVPTPATRTQPNVIPIDYRLWTRYNLKMPVSATDTTLFGGIDSIGHLLQVASGSKQGVWYRDTVATGGHKWAQLYSPANLTNYWQLSGSDLTPINTSYEVGIGTATPLYKFHVVNGGEFWFDGTRMNLSTATGSNKFIGLNSGVSNLGEDNIGIGDYTVDVTNGDGNIGIGESSLYNANGSYNVGVGLQSGLYNPMDGNVSIGYTANNKSYGGYNIAIGLLAQNAASITTSTLNNSVISVGTTTITGASVATFITNTGYAVNDTAVFYMVFSGTLPPPFTIGSTINKLGKITASNTITFLNSSTFTGQGTGTFDITTYNKQTNSIAIGSATSTQNSNEIAIGNASSTLLRMNQFIVDLDAVPVTNQILSYDGNKWIPTTAAGATGVSSVAGTSPINVADGLADAVVSIDDASTVAKGAASFNASDFIVIAGNVTINYAAGQTASTSLKGFLSATDWNTFNAKQQAITGAASTITTSDLTALRALVSDGSGKVAVSSVTTTELAYSSGVTSAIQTQLNAKLSTALTSARIFVGNVSNVATAVVMSGDATIDNIGAVTLSSVVSPGTCGSCNLTIGADGRVTAYTDGTGGGGAGTVTSVLGTSPIISDGDLVTPTLSILDAKADGSTKGAAWFSSSDFNDNSSGGISTDYANGQSASAINKGYLTAADWSTFNNKVPTSVTISAGTGLTGGGDLSTNRTLSLANTAVTPGSYTIANITVDAQGRITAAANGSAGGTGTVTSVAASVPTGFTVTGSPITTSGTIAISTALNGMLYGNGSNTIAAATITSPLLFSSGTLSIQQATGAQSGFLTSADWTTFNSKQATITGGATTIVSSNLTANRALVSSGGGKVAVSAVTATELGFVSGVTSAIQTQLNGKEPSIIYAFQILTDGATVTLNGNLGINFRVTLAGNRTLALSNIITGKVYKIEINQDATGNRHLTLPATSLVGGGGSLGSGTSIILSTAALKKDLATFFYDGSNYYWTLTKDFQ